MASGTQKTAVPGYSAVLQAPIFTNTPLSRPLKCIILDRLWPLPDSQTLTSVQDADSFEAYFSRFERECAQSIRDHHAMQKFSDFVIILETIRGNPDASLSAVRLLLANAAPALRTDQAKLSASIELVVSLWLLVSVRITMPTHRHLLETSLPWPENVSLLSVLKSHLTQPAPSQVTTVEAFSDHFNVVDIDKIAGISVLWTENLGEHLAAKNSCVYLFHHVAALKRLRDSPPCNAFLPPALLTETLATLDLLIPLDDARCNSWLRTSIARLALDTQLVYRRAPSAGRSKRAFVFWQDRLAAFSDAFDRARPAGFAQWWADRRDMGRWWNYWLVVAGLGLTVLFGPVQSVTGVMQVAGVGAGAGAGGGGG